MSDRLPLPISGCSRRVEEAESLHESRRTNEEGYMDGTSVQKLHPSSAAFPNCTCGVSSKSNASTTN